MPTYHLNDKALVLIKTIQTFVHIVRLRGNGKIPSMPSLFACKKQQTTIWKNPPFSTDIFEHYNGKTFSKYAL